MSTPTTVFGRRLRHARESRNLTQIQLGVLIGLDEGSSSARISRYEGGVHEPSMQLAQRLAVVLNVPLAYLYSDEDSLADLILLYSQISTADRSDLHQWLRARVPAA